MFIVEGDSAGGSAKQGRKREFQAVLPIRGKILNVERARTDKMLSSEQVTNIIAALGTGIGRDEFNIAKLRYHKIIIMTDADVDGAHIRTLLLTFFYRQMPELVEKGHLYIAQPPLYKVAKGKSGTYLKDQRALEDYLIDTGLDGTTLQLGSGEMRAGQGPARHRRAGARHRQDHRRAAFPLRPLRRRAGGDRRRLRRQAAALRRGRDQGGRRRRQASRSASPRKPSAAGPAASATTASCSSARCAASPRCSHLDRALLGSLEARRLNERHGHLQEIYATPPILKRKDDETVIYGPRTLLEAVYETGRKGLSLQRYKGLGEMNPEQLWETTLDRDARTLLQVKVGDLNEADEIFSKLMGDVVEPRREFIQENALNVANLDV